MKAGMQLLLSFHRAMIDSSDCHSRPFPDWYIYIYTHEIKAGYQMIRLKTSSNWAPGTKTIMHCTLSLMRTYCLFIIPEWRCGHPLILWSVCALKLFLFLCQLSWRPRKRQKRWRCSRWSKQWSLDLDDFDMFWWKTKNLESWCGSWTNCSTSWCLFCFHKLQCSNMFWPS